MRINFKKPGFTLSEVMITLSLIGVLATLTVSTIGASVQQNARLAEFKTAMSKLENAQVQAEKDAGRSYKCYRNQDDNIKYSINNKTYTEIQLFGFKKMTGENTTSQCFDTKSGNKGLLDEMARNLGLLKVCSNGLEDGCLPQSFPTTNTCFNGKSKTYLLENSMILITSSAEDKANFAVDINGKKGPNRWGQDIFPFAFTIKSGDSVLAPELGLVSPSSTCEVKNPDNKVTKSTKQMLLETYNLAK